MLAKSLNRIQLLKTKTYSVRLSTNVFSNHRFNQHALDGHLNIWDEELKKETKLKIEEYWKNKLNYSEYDPKKDHPKFYVLSMFPYPSGNLHMGHIRVYSISDTIARFYRMLGKNVIHPMGWDAFGLPAENAAIERGQSSAAWTSNNISMMREQLKQLGCTFDWSREVATCDTQYYKFTQHIFLKLYEHGLVYQKKALVNWDPVDQTVLADEQVDEDGCSWRSGAKVEKKALKQWFIRTTSFAKALYDGLNREDLEDWKDIIDMQKNWIGPCNGVSFEFPLKEVEGGVTLWSDRPEYLPMAKFIVVAPGSVLDLESEGCGNRKLGFHVVNTLTGQLLPIYVSDKMTVHEGSDAHIGIPGVYEEDSKFAKEMGLVYDEESVKTVANDDSARQDVIDKIKGRVMSSKIKDWLISRQRHWGTPIPVVHCHLCGAQPVPYDQLPVKLPAADRVTEKGHHHISEQWLSTSCPKCGGLARRDQDTMDTFVDSSWYYLRYTDPHNQLLPFSQESADRLMPVDIYVGGKEHAVLHLYYARFMSYFLHSLGLLPDPEPFKRLLVQGMVLGKTYRVKGTGKFIPEDQVDLLGEQAVERESGRPVSVSWDKMSKSKHNGVDPAAVFREYGVDTTRLIIMGSVSPTSPRNWDDRLFPGILNWQHRIWLTIQEFRQAKSRMSAIQVPSDLAEVEERLKDSRNYYLLGVTKNYCVSHYFNIVISKLQGLLGDLRRYGEEYKAHSVQFERCLVLHVIALSPLSPHFAAQLWSGMQTCQGLFTADEHDWSRPAHLQRWPQIDRDYKLSLTCKVNGAIKDTVGISCDQFDQLTVSSATQLALTSDHVRVYTDQSPVLSASLKLYLGIFAAVDLNIDHTKLVLKREPKKKKKAKIKIEQ